MQIPDREIIIAALDEVYRGPAWHGPAVLEALDGVDATMAVRSAFATRNSIWDLVLHLAHARHLLIERVTKITEDFPREIREPWWPISSADRSESTWRNDLVLLDAYHQKLVDTIRGATDEALARQPTPGDQAVGRQLLGMAIHDAYHAGQIRLLVLAAHVT
jgi:uncharacterized damage-inducible protein DinB